MRTREFRLIRFLLLGWFAGTLAASDAYADTRMLFPRVVLQLGRFSGIAIANPGDAAAEIGIRARNPDGSDFQPRAQLTIPAGGQIARLAYELIGAPASAVQNPVPTRLWLEVTSEADGLTGFYLEGSDTVSQSGALSNMDGSALSGAGVSLIVPLIENSGSSATEISVVNTDESEAAAVHFSFVRDDGSVAATPPPATIPPLGALQGPVGGFFSIDYTGVTSLRVQADRPVVCYASVFRQPDDSLVTVPAQNTDLPSKTLLFPQLAEGDGWSTAIGLVNSTASAVVVTLAAYTGDGELFGPGDVSENPVSRVIPAGGRLSAGVAALFGFKSAPLETGWVRAEASAPSLHGYVEYGAGTNRALVPAQSGGSAHSIFSHQALQPPYFTGLAVLNASGVAANVEVVSMDAGSGVLGKTQQVLKPGQRESLLVQQWVPAAAGASGGSVYVKSDVPVVATQLFGTDSLAALANVPPQEAPSTFDPGAALPGLKVSPPLAVVETGKSAKFSSSGVPGPSWSVNGVAGGSSAFGTVSASGQYTAPALAPEDNTIVVQATAGGGSVSGGATIDVVQRETLASGLGLVTSVAFVENVGRFFVAEQQLLSAGPSGTANADVGSTRIFEQAPSGTVSLYTEVPNDVIPKMLPFADSDGVPYLLLAGQASGTLYRLRLTDKQLVTFATGLHQPNSLVIDSLSGNLFVSEEDRVSVIDRPTFDPTASAPLGPLRTEGRFAAPTAHEVAFLRPLGVASNGCDGSVLLTLGDGTLREVQGSRQRVLLSGLNDPRQILTLYRQAPSCAEALTVVIVESTRVQLYFPAARSSLPLLSDFESVRDLTFFPGGRAFGTIQDPTIALAERRSGAGAGRVVRIRVGPRYGNVAPSMPLVSGEPAVRDPAGDTFETDASDRLAVPDLQAADAHLIGGRTVVTLVFTRPVTPERLGRPNGLTGFVDFDSQPGGAPPHFTQYNLFNPLGELGIEAFVDIARGVLFFDPRSPDSVPVPVKYMDRVVSILLPPGFPEPSKFRFAVVAGNRAEATDVFPNIGSARPRP